MSNSESEKPEMKLAALEPCGNAALLLVIGRLIVFIVCVLVTTTVLFGFWQSYRHPGLHAVLHTNRLWAAASSHGQLYLMDYQLGDVTSRFDQILLQEGHLFCIFSRQDAPSPSEPDTPNSVSVPGGGLIGVSLSRGAFPAWKSAEVSSKPALGSQPKSRELRIPYWCLFTGFFVLSVACGKSIYSAIKSVPDRGFSVDKQAEGTE